MDEFPPTFMSARKLMRKYYFLQKNNEMIYRISCFILFLSFIIPTFSQSSPEIIQLENQVKMSLEKGIAFFYSINIEGGYVYHYTLDLKEKWGEGKTDDRTVEVQPPGTPSVGISFLRAYECEKNPLFLRAAEDAADALIKGQNELGGWEHKIYFDRPKGNRVSFDDNQTQSAISFLMKLDMIIDNDQLTMAIEKALKMMLNTQLENGGWPHQYPSQGNYHDFATFNDRGINDCIRVMLEAQALYPNPDYRKSLDKVGRFLLIAQLPPPQPGWAQQYNEYLQPAWARSFEPPAVCPLVTVYNIQSLLDLFKYTSDRKYLEPVTDAIRWLKESRLTNGKWGRFLEIGTNKPLYYDRDRIRVNSLEELSLERRTGYGYEVDISEKLKSVEILYHKYLSSGVSEEGPKVEKDFQQLFDEVKEIIATQDESGRWIVKKDKFRKNDPGYNWNGEYRFEDRISSALFNHNVGVLCEFLERIQ